MATVSLPVFEDGDVFDASHINEIKEAIQDGTKDINTGALESTAITQNDVNVVTTESLAGDIGHGWYKGDRTESDYLNIPADTADTPFGLRVIDTQDVRPTGTQGSTPYWSITDEQLDIVATSGEGNIRVSFKAYPQRRDHAIGFAAVIPTPTPIILTSEVRSLGRVSQEWRNVSFNIPFFIDAALVSQYGIEFYITNNEAASGSEGYVRICEETVLIQQFGGAL